MFKSCEEIPLHFAVFEGDNQKLEVLLKDSSVDVNQQDTDENTALHHAVDMNYISLVEILLKQTNIEVNKQNKEGNTPLHMAYLNGSNEIKDLLLRAGASDEIENKREKFPSDYGPNPRDGGGPVAVYGGPPRFRSGGCSIL